MKFAGELEDSVVIKRALLVVVPLLVSFGVSLAASTLEPILDIDGYRVHMEGQELREVCPWLDRDPDGKTLFVHSKFWVDLDSGVVAAVQGESLSFSGTVLRTGLRKEDVTQILGKGDRSFGRAELYLFPRSKLLVRYDALDQTSSYLLMRLDYTVPLKEESF